MKYEKPQIACLDQALLAVYGTNMKAPTTMTESVYSPDRMTLPTYVADE